MRLLEFLQDKSGQLSSARLFALLVSLAFVADYVAHIIRSANFDPTLTTVSTVLGVLGFKVLQKQFEK